MREKVQGSSKACCGNLSSTRLLLHKTTGRDTVDEQNLHSGKDVYRAPVVVSMRTNCFSRLSEASVCDQVSLQKSAVPKGKRQKRTYSQGLAPRPFSSQVRSILAMATWKLGCESSIRHAQGILKDGCNQNTQGINTASV